MKVGIVMGSDSDLPVMKDAAEILEKFGVNYEIDIISAHRTPDLAMEYGRSAEERGIEVIIAGAGGAAHLPGVLAALTTLPVIGVPIMSQALKGLDSLLSIVQMPAGIPVATVAINNAKNAGINPQNEPPACICMISEFDLRTKKKHPMVFLYTFATSLITGCMNLVGEVLYISTSAPIFLRKLAIDIVCLLTPPVFSIGLIIEIIKGLLNIILLS